MSDFLPKEYKMPETVGGYMRFKQGDNQFRVLSEAITGYEYWTKDKKPVRLHKYPDSLPKNIQMNGDVPSPVKHFWAFVVWNYDVKAPQILEITQKSIQKDIEKYIKNKKWGNPSGYDLTVTRSGEGLETEYATVAEPHAELPAEIKKAYESKYINLNALFDGADPFTKDSKAPVDYPTETITPEDIPF